MVGPPLTLSTQQQRRREQRASVYRHKFGPGRPSYWSLRLSTSCADHFLPPQGAGKGPYAHKVVCEGWGGDLPSYPSG